MCLGSSNSTPVRNPFLEYNNGNVFDPKEEEQTATDTSSTNNNPDNSNNSKNKQPDLTIPAPKNNAELASRMQTGLNKTFFVPRVKYKVKQFFK